MAALATALGTSAVAGPIAGAVTGGIQLISSAIQKKKADRLAPPLEDPEMRQFLSEIQRRRKSFQTGSAYQGALRQIKQLQAGTIRGVARTTGGSVGAMIAGGGMAQRIAGEQIGKLQAMGERQEQFLTKLQLGVQKNIEERKLNLQRIREQRMIASAAESKSTGLANILAAAGHVLPVGEETKDTITSPTIG